MNHQFSSGMPPYPNTNQTPYPPNPNQNNPPYQMPQPGFAQPVPNVLPYSTLSAPQSGFSTGQLPTLPNASNLNSNNPPPYQSYGFQPTPSSRLPYPHINNMAPGFSPPPQGNYK
ncbi:nematocyst expressed protein 4-like [Sitodiplosis mosellana]|uniref:nematocyst expressed protein 4-like n=1 Tax=Sitodiplosis mosellana TaxID=263140 RepID=UPI002443EF0E|nr:nematocyst expressed protein 4-like [Sitodiplosis mosellana]